MLKKILISSSFAAALMANSGFMNLITPDETVKILQDGNERFVSDKVARPYTDMARLGEHPQQFRILVEVEMNKKPTKSTHNEVKPVAKTDSPAKTDASIFYHL